MAWYYTKREVHLSMSAYIEKALRLGPAQDVPYAPILWYVLIII